MYVMYYYHIWIIECFFKEVESNFYVFYHFDVILDKITFTFDEQDFSLNIFLIIFGIQILIGIG